MRGLGVTRQKAGYCLEVAAAVESGRLNFRRLSRAADDCARDELTAVKGIGPWTADVYLLMALRVYKEVGYEYMITPDHVPGISGPEAGQVGFAFTYGYIHAHLQAIGEE